MNKNLIVSGIVFVLLIVIFCGCTDKEPYYKSNEIELISYNVTTQKWDEEQKVISGGFLHSDEADFYYINGTVKNISNETLIKVNVTAKFYNNTNNLLTERTTYLGGLLINHTGEFGIYYFSNEEYFEEICGVKFEFEVT